MAKNKIEHLRDHLFEAIELLKDEESSMTVDKAEAIASLSQQIINTAKLEIDFAKTVDSMNGLSTPTEFLQKQLNK